jgi:hypothetical protein
MMGKLLFELRTGLGAGPEKMELDIQFHACHNGSAVFFGLISPIAESLKRSFVELVFVT